MGDRQWGWNKNLGARQKEALREARGEIDFSLEEREERMELEELELRQVGYWKLRLENLRKVKREAAADVNKNAETTQNRVAGDGDDGDGDVVFLKTQKNPRRQPSSEESETDTSTVFDGGGEFEMGEDEAGNESEQNEETAPTNGSDREDDESTTPTNGSDREDDDSNGNDEDADAVRASVGELTSAELGKMTMAKIKELLKPKGIKVGGNKIDLIRKYLKPRPDDYKQRQVRKRKKSKTLKEKYHAYLVRFMNYNDKPDPPYDEFTVFTKDQLYSVEPIHIVNWFNHKSFHTENPGKSFLSIFFLFVTFLHWL